LFISTWALLLVSIVISNNTIFSPEELTNGLGIVSTFPITYWIGFVCLAILIAFLLLGPEEHYVTYLLTLVATGGYLFGFVVVIQRVPFESWTFPPFFFVNDLLALGHLSQSSNPTLFYSLLPVYNLFNASLLLLTGLPEISLLTIMPIIWILAFPTITFGGCRMLNLRNKLSFCVVIIATGASNFSYAGYEYPRLIGTLMLLLFFGLLLSDKTGTPFWIMNALLMIAMTLTHPFIIAAALGSIFLIFLFRRKFFQIVLSFALFLGFYIFFAYSYINAGLSALLSGQIGLEQHLQNLALQNGSSSFGTIMVRYMTFFVFLAFGLITIWAIFKVLSPRSSQPTKKQLIPIILVIFGVGAQLAFNTSIESEGRVLELVIYPLSIAFVYFISTRVSWKVITILLVFSLLFSSPIINFANNTYYYFGPESAMTGFYSVHQTGKQFYYLFDEGDMYFYNDSFNALNVGRWGFESPYNYTGMSLSPFVIMSYLSTTMFGSPYVNWPNTSAGLGSDKIYDNGYSQVYANMKVLLP
jgi:hypothetical protein